MQETNLDIECIARTLKKHSVRYIVVGGIAVYLHGGETLTTDIDLAIHLEDNNLESLADALEEIDAVPKRWKKPFRLTRTDLSASWLHLDSDAGQIDLLTKTPGATFEELEADKKIFMIGGEPLPVASIQSLIKMKSGTGREKDVRHVQELNAILNLTNPEKPPTT